MEFIKIITLTFLTIIMFSCSEDSTSPKVDNEEDPIITGSYFPLTIDNMWKYDKDIIYNVVKETTVITGTKEIEGKEYFVITTTTSNNVDDVYCRVEGDYIIQCIDSYDEENFIYNEKFKINGAVGDSWDLEFVDNNDMPVRKNYTISGFEDQKQVIDTEFKDILVIKLNESRYVEYLGQWLASTPATIYFARGVGLIELSEPGNLVRKITEHEVTAEEEAN